VTTLPHIARVIVELSLDREFDYLIPEALRSTVVVGARVEVPFGNTWKYGFVITLQTSSSFAELKEIKRVIGDGSYLADDVIKLARWISDYYVCPFESTIRTVLPAPVRKNNTAFRKQKMIHITEAGQTMLAAAPGKSPKQTSVLKWLAENGPTPQRELTLAVQVTPAVIKALEEKLLVTSDEGTRMRDPFKDHVVVPTKPLDLMPQQQDALTICNAAIDAATSQVIVLNGVTGSGKTEVYLQAIAYAVAKGKGAIVLVPEIALTPQTVDRFRSRFGDVVAVLHSDLSDGERHDEWHRIRTGHARIVVGARSALFAPVPQLALIVVDEEHESSYKQDEAPRYHARDMAVVRGHITGCAVVLGSATPSLESMLNVRKGKYREVKMPHRIDHRTMPHMRIVDLRGKAEGKDTKTYALSSDLVEAIRLRLDRSEQTILFLNRRGFSKSLICQKCGEAPKCEHCSVTLTYHKVNHKLMCHFCATEYPVPDKCPNVECRDPNFKFSGLGTQRIEEIVHKVFPTAKIHRMDSDTMTKRESYRTVLGDFKSGKIDILLGTQMIAKGLDFPNVTLVGVIMADMSLQVPDFRSAERTFQLLTQVAGRAGRGDISGEVIVQTFSPQHWAIQSARRMDFETFIDQELAFREELDYPPYAHLVCVTCRGPEAEVVQKIIQEVADQMRTLCPDNVVISGPAPSPLARLKGEYRFQVLFRARQSVTITRPLRQVVKAVKWPKKVHCAIDVDSLDMI